MHERRQEPNLAAEGLKIRLGESRLDDLRVRVRRRRLRFRPRQLLRGGLLELGDGLEEILLHLVPLASRRRVAQLLPQALEDVALHLGAGVHPPQVLRDGFVVGVQFGQRRVPRLGPGETREDQEAVLLDGEVALQLSRRLDHRGAARGEQQTAHAALLVEVVIRVKARPAAEVHADDAIRLHLRAPALPSRGGGGGGVTVALRLLVRLGFLLLALAFDTLLPLPLHRAERRRLLHPRLLLLLLPVLLRAVLRAVLHLRAHLDDLHPGHRRGLGVEARRRQRPSALGRLAPVSVEPKLCLLVLRPELRILRRGVLNLLRDRLHRLLLRGARVGVRLDAAVPRAFLPPHRVGHRLQLVPQVVIVQDGIQLGVGVAHFDVRAQEHAPGDGAQPPGGQHVLPRVHRGVQRRVRRPGTAERQRVVLRIPLQSAVVPVAQRERHVVPPALDATKQLLRLFRVRAEVMLEQRLDALAVVLALLAGHLPGGVASKPRDVEHLPAEGEERTGLGLVAERAAKAEAAVDATRHRSLRVGFPVEGFARGGGRERLVVEALLHLSEIKTLGRPSAGGRRGQGGGAPAAPGGGEDATSDDAEARSTRGDRGGGGGDRRSGGTAPGRRDGGARATCREGDELSTRCMRRAIPARAERRRAARAGATAQPGGHAGYQHRRHEPAGAAPRRGGLCGRRRSSRALPYPADLAAPIGSDTPATINPPNRQQA